MAGLRFCRVITCPEVHEPAEMTDNILQGGKADDKR